MNQGAPLTTLCPCLTFQDQLPLQDLMSFDFRNTKSTFNQGVLP